MQVGVVQPCLAPYFFIRKRVELLSHKFVIGANEDTVFIGANEAINLLLVGRLIITNLINCGTLQMKTLSLLENNLHYGWEYYQSQNHEL